MDIIQWLRKSKFNKMSKILLHNVLKLEYILATTNSKKLEYNSHPLIRQLPQKATFLR
jgi:hypothetical protein